MDIYIYTLHICGGLQKIAGLRVYIQKVKESGFGAWRLRVSGAGSHYVNSDCSS